MKTDELLAIVQIEASERNDEVLLRLLDFADKFCEYAKAKIRAVWLQQKYNGPTNDNVPAHQKNALNWEYEKLISNITYHLVPCDYCEGCILIREGNIDNLPMYDILSKAVPKTKRPIPPVRSINDYEVVKGGPEAVCTYHGWARPWDPGEGYWE